ncbi:MAG: nucleotidyltransferase family protein [Deltaproteobacteria bacterium]|nr:nucleotidyltransferase family protein [Deltaproteobacteria bacterium]
MGQDKALLSWPPGGNGTLLAAAIQALSEYCDLVLVVTGNNRTALEPVIDGWGATLVPNPAPEQGQFSSLQTGLRQLLNRGWDNAMVTLVDRPPPKSCTLSRLVDDFLAREHEIWAVVPEYQGKHGHPLLVGREMIEAFLKAPQTANARAVEGAYRNRLRYLSTDDPLVIANLNTPEDYVGLKSLHSI